MVFEVTLPYVHRRLCEVFGIAACIIVCHPLDPHYPLLVRSLAFPRSDNSLVKTPLRSTNTLPHTLDVVQCLIKLHVGHGV